MQVRPQMHHDEGTLGRLQQHDGKGRVLVRQDGAEGDLREIVEHHENVGAGQRL